MVGKWSAKISEVSHNDYETFQTNTLSTFHKYLNYLLPVP